VQLVAVALRATDRRWDSGGYRKYPAACGGVLYFIACPNELRAIQPAKITKGTGS
jgi:hypothetical protein